MARPEMPTKDLDPAAQAAVQVSIDTALLKAVGEFIEAHPELGIRDRRTFVDVAVRWYLERQQGRVVELKRLPKGKKSREPEP
jgi:hypothetical protein